ncbi:MAG: hypothetical protein JWM90_2683 [Thermoleophilia bacterium]|nr:hypothetical protein [Thermoleophilia bacterium]
MKLTIPQPILAANTSVVAALRSAQADASTALARIESSGFDDQVAALTTSASTASLQALTGALELGRGNLLDPTTHRYAQHAVRDLTAAANYSQRAGGDGDALKLLGEALKRGEISARLGADAGDRSLTDPQPRPANDGSPVGDGSGGSSTGGGTWVDGEWLDDLGNPTRSSGDSWTGHDGQSYGSDGGVTGAPGRGGDTWSGPDGTGYSGI